jgi:hypothetical protein
MLFLCSALAMATRAVYSMHKTSTRDYVLGKALEWGGKGEVVATLKFDIPKMYAFHREKCKDVEVDLLRFEKVSQPDPADIAADLQKLSLAGKQAVAKPEAARNRERGRGGRAGRGTRKQRKGKRR